MKKVEQCGAKREPRGGMRTGIQIVCRLPKDHKGPHSAFMGRERTEWHDVKRVKTTESP